MASKEIDPVYLILDENTELKHSKISAENLFRMPPSHNNIRFVFETSFTPFNQIVEQKLPNVDVVITDQESGEHIRPLEIKLTTLPDNTTVDLPDDEMGSEIVVRPDTIVYLALGIANNFRQNRHILKKHLEPLESIRDWTSTDEIITRIDIIKQVLENLMLENLDTQRPLLVQPIWKTKGQTPVLEEHAFDVFVWSDFGLTRLFFRETVRKKIPRGTRSLVWLAKMLYDFAVSGKVNNEQVIDTITFNTKNDKAFSVAGSTTYKLMKCSELTKPRVKKDALKYIIQGGGENFLSPERRLDAAIWLNNNQVI